MPAIFNITYICHNLLTVIFDGSRMTWESPPHLHSTFSKLMFLLPYWDKLWLTVSLWLTPTNTNIGTFYFLIFPTIQHMSNFLKLTCSYQYNYTHFLLNFTDIFIFNTVAWTFCFLFVNIIVKFFTYLLVWFSTQCFVLSLQPYPWYNIPFWLLHVFIKILNLFISIFLLKDIHLSPK